MSSWHAGENGRMARRNAKIIAVSSGGAVAQLGARLDGIEEVVGSNPISSTKTEFLAKISAYKSPAFRKPCYLYIAFALLRG